MTFSITPMGPAELERVRILPDTGFGALRTERGNLPLDRLDVRAAITGLVARTVVTTEFVNENDTALEATYVFPLPDRAAVTGMTMTADGRRVDAELQERGAAREEYDRAVAAGQRASIAEEDRPDVFTMRAGTIMPGERVTVELRLTGPLPYEDGAATFRFPLVVAPRYVPGRPLPGTPAGDGVTPDTDAVPDASRISPPVLLPGFANPLRLSLGVDIDPGGLTLGAVRSSLHTVSTSDGRVELRPGEKADRDFVLRLDYAGASTAAVAVPDETGDEGTLQLTVLPPDGTGTARPKDVVLLLDRSGSMGGWKMVAARRAAARVVDTLTAADRFAVLTFDDRVDRPDELGEGLSEANDRNRFRAVEHLAAVTARGGTELLGPLHAGLSLLAGAGSRGRDTVLVLVTDGQVGNEDQILADVAPLVGTTRVHTVGIDRAVNAGFLGRLAAAGAGRTELVESEDRLDEAMEHIHRRIGAPVLTGVTVTAEGLHLDDATRSPARLPGLYPGVPLVLTGRYTGSAEGTVTVTGRTRDDEEFRVEVPVRRRSEPAVTARWARARLRDLEDRYAAGDRRLEEEIVATSLRFGVLCRFTAFVAVDSRVVNEGGDRRRVVQPVELPSGWEVPQDVAPPMMMLGRAMPMSAPGSAGGAPAPAPPAPGGPGGPGGPGLPGAPMPVRAMRARGGAPDARGGTRAGKIGSVGGPQGFLAPAGMRPAGVRHEGGLEIGDARRIASVEADRLRAAADAPPARRRDELDDLVSRLTVLLSDAAGPQFAPLRSLLEVLRDDTRDLNARWSEALAVLTAFGEADPDAEARHDGAETGDAAGEAGTAARPGRRKPFWKR